MGLKTYILGLIVVSFVWIILPGLLILLNNLLGLPVLDLFPLKLIGIVTFIVGIFFVLYFYHLHILSGRFTPLPLVESPKKFIHEGFYRYCRNPMYIATLTVFLSAFLILGYFLLLLYFLFSAFILNMFVVKVEEPELKKKFGKDYIEYTKEVPRWFPRIRKKS